jgi:intein/homing endonuclease
MPEEQAKQEKLSYLLGALYGDGCFSRAEGKGRIHFGSTDLDFAESLSKTIDDLFSLKVIIGCAKLSKKNPKHRDFHTFSSRPLYRILEAYQLSEDMKLPSLIAHGNQQVKGSFIRGFFDAEGSVHSTVVKSRNEVQRRIQCAHKSFALLEQIREMLSKFGIKTAIFNGHRTYFLSIWSYQGLTRYREMAGFSIKRKSQKLDEVIGSYKEIQTQWNDGTYRAVMKLRYKGLGARKIRTRFLEKGIDIPLPTVEAWIYRKVRNPEVTEMQEENVKTDRPKERARDNVVLIGKA